MKTFYASGVEGVLDFVKRTEQVRRELCPSNEQEIFNWLLDNQDILGYQWYYDFASGFSDAIMRDRLMEIAKLGERHDEFKAFE